MRTNTLKSNNVVSCKICPVCGKLSPLTEIETEGLFKRNKYYKCNYGCGYKFKKLQLVPVRINDFNYKLSTIIVMQKIGRFLAGMTSAIGSIVLLFVVFGFDKNGKYTLGVIMKCAYDNLGLLPLIVGIFMLICIFYVFSKLIYIGKE